MNETAIVEWLPQVQRIGVALVVGFVPALIARWNELGPVREFWYTSFHQLDLAPTTH